MMIFWVVLLLAVLAFFWLLIQRGGRGYDPGPNRREAETDRGEAILRERYARGEIDSETYHRMLDDLRDQRH